MSEDAKKPLGRILLRQRAVTQPDLDEALASGEVGGLPLATRMIESGTLSEIAALKALSEQSGVPGIDLNQICVRLTDLSILPKEVAVRHRLLPVLVRDDRVFVAMAAPTEKKVIDEIEFVTGKHVFPYIALAGPLMRVISSAYEMRDRGEAFYVGPQCPPEIQRRAGLAPVQVEAPAEVGRTTALPPAPPAPARSHTPGGTPAMRAQLAGPREGSVVARPPQASSSSPGPREGSVVARLGNVGGGPSHPPPLPSRRNSPAQGSLRPSLEGPPPSEPTLPPSRKSDPDAGFRPGYTGTLTPAPPRPGATGPAAAVARVAASLSPVIVDDAMGKIAVADELTDADFGLADRDLSVMTSLPKAAPPPAKDGQRTVLIVDDELDIRKLLRRVFDDRGYRVLEADRGLMALSMVKEHMPDVLILDAMLPELHGFDIAKRLKGSERYGHIPIVMVSAVYRGWRFAEDLKTSYGVDAYLEKPFKVADVVRAVENALERNAQPQDAEKISAEAEKMLNAGIAAYKQGDIPTAIEHLREGTRLDPLAYRLHYHLGLLYGKQGRVYDAIQELQTALEINGRHFPALKNLAVLYQKAGFRNKAIEIWERALAVAPDDPTRQSIKEHLVGLL
jgi:DNA-binding response OmpR family regulator